MFAKLRLTSKFSEFAPRRRRSRIKVLAKTPVLEALEVRTMLASLITDLGSMTPTAINQIGDVVGNDPDAVIYSNGTLTQLGNLGGGYSIATGINDEGQVVGNSETTSGKSDPFLYSRVLNSPGTMTDLGTFPGDDSSSASAINDSGQVAGGSDVYVKTNGGEYFGRAILFSYATPPGISDLGNLGFKENSPLPPVAPSPVPVPVGNIYVSNGATDINSSGQVVGYSTTPAFATHAFIYNNGQISDLGTLGGSYSKATGINDSRKVVGYSTTGTFKTHAFLSINGQMSDLGTLGGSRSEATGINDSGQVVGYADTSGGVSHAFLYSDGTMTDLNTLLPTGSSWTLNTAVAINDKGQIVGTGEIGGKTHGFLLDLSGPQINPTSPQWDVTDGGVDYGYSITVGDLPEATTVDLFWASGTTVDTEIGDPIAARVTETTQGTYPLQAFASELTDPPQGAKYLLVVADPQNLISPANPDKLASLALPEITPTAVTFDTTDGGVDYGYTISDADLPRATTVELYWASSTTIASEIGASFSVTTTETAQGTYGPVHLARSSIGDPPIGAKYILAVADPAKDIVVSDRFNTVQALAIPSISIPDFEWNQDLNATAGNFTHRGIDFDYAIGASNLPIATTLSFYWASGVNPKDIIAPAVDQTTGQPSKWQIDPTEGLHNQAQSGYRYMNDPARWGTPPPGAFYILAITDYYDKVIKQADRISGPFAIASVPLATEAEILQGSVTVTPDKSTMSATFSPGKGSIFVSEAEVSLGVDHFDWQQQIYYDPPTWQTITIIGQPSTLVVAIGDVLYPIQEGSRS
jgi:probable HAF family extracellular repeat protein